LDINKSNKGGKYEIYSFYRYRRYLILWYENESQKRWSYKKSEKKDYVVASFCGAGLGEDELKLLDGVDIVISSDIPHHVIVACDNLGISVISLTHYASEFFGFLKFYEQIKEQSQVQVFINNDEHLL
jgi:putative NIF3 family GTP cyclohydrolase 1 type 2